MRPEPAAIRRDLIHIGVKKRFVGHLLGLAAVALRLKKLFKTNRNAEKVLIIEPFGLGDMISLEPLVRALKQRGYKVGLCGRKAWRPLYPEDGQLQWIDADLPWCTHNEREKYAVRDYTSAQFRTFLRTLKDWGDGTIGLDTRGDIRSVGLLRLAG